MRFSYFYSNGIVSFYTFWSSKNLKRLKALLIMFSYRIIVLQVIFCTFNFKVSVNFDYSIVVHPTLKSIFEPEENVVRKHYFIVTQSKCFTARITKVCTYLTQIYSFYSISLNSFKYVMEILLIPE